MNEESYLDLSLTKVAKRCNHLDLSAFFFRTNSYGNPYEFYFDEIRTKNPYEFFEEKLTEICLFLTRKIVKTIRTDFSKKTRTSLSSFHWENRTENSYGFFQRKKRTT